MGIYEGVNNTVSFLIEKKIKMISYLLTNDDGMGAEGLESLERVFLENRIIVAPMKGMSLCSHQVTTDIPLVIEKREEGRYAVSGTPADCVRLAIQTLSKPLDKGCWVMSGINRGGNLGVDIYHSGTVAAVREATFHGYNGIAFSQYVRRDSKIDWDWSTRQAARVWELISTQNLLAGHFWNVNLPHLQEGDNSDPAIIFCGVSKRPLPLAFEQTVDGWKYSGVYSQRLSEKGSDVDHVFSGRIAVSQIGIGNM